jgi:UDP-N-acetylmuramate dehydrogenase
VRGVQKYEQAEHMVYEVGAGEEWDAIVQRSVADNCAGLECLAGIPGTVGGTPVQNVGAYGQEVASTILSVRAFDMKTLAFVDLSPAECGFAYRRSRFNTADRGRYVITRVAYSLMPGGAATIRYADLQNEFSGRSDPSVKEVAEAVRQVRRTKGMLLVDGDPNCRSAGSFFKNPVVRAEQMHLIAANEGKDPPHFPVGSQEQQSGCAKIPAAWLIEHAGFAKGFAQGQAGISSRHTLALINRGGAKAAEILALADQIASAVNSHFGIQLEREPVLLGFEESC